MIGTGDGAVVDRVEDPGGAFGFWVAAERRSFPFPCLGGLDRIAAGVGGRDDLIGTAVKKLGGAGLLASEGVLT